ncbi:MAG: ABC transporter permease [Mesorhizobium sp.]|nr:MAG: ABC transporter permease [Mesorhizobium sp.]
MDVHPVAKTSLLSGAMSFVRMNPVVLFGIIVLAVFIIMAAIAPWVLEDPRRVNAIHRLKPPSTENPFGTDQIGRSILSRTFNGATVSLTVGVTVMALTGIFGLIIGLMCIYNRWLDGITMRVMDGLMAIPSILLAIALMSLFGTHVRNVIIAITVAEVPRMARVVRSAVLVIREQPYVEAASASGVGPLRLLLRHVLPNASAPIIVQATYVFASAMLIEAALSFLGAGSPPIVPSWGNMLAEGRTFLQRAPWLLVFPGLALSILVLTVNVVGDALRDALDPKLAKQTRF